MKYRKKPVVVEAFCWLVDEAPEWWLEASGKFKMNTKTGSVFILTLEGDMEARKFDFIVQGVAGEIYPVKPHIFAATYEPVE